MTRHKNRLVDPIIQKFTQQTQTMEENKIVFSVDTLLTNSNNFEGKPEQDVNYFISQFNEIAEAAKIPKDLKLIFFKSKLAGIAKDILINTPSLREEKNYDNFITNFKVLFKSERSFVQAQDQFTQAKQTPTQSVADFTKNLNMSAQKYLATSGHAAKEGAIDFLNTIKLSKFIQGLRSEIKFELEKFPPDSFDNAVSMAKKIEIALNNRNITEVNNIETQKNTAIYDAILQMSESHNKQMKEITEQVNSIRINGQTPNQIQVETNKPFCHICQKDNHITQNCFYNAKNSSQSSNTRNIRFNTPRHRSNNFRYPPRFHNNAPQNFSQWPRHTQQNYTQNYPPTYFQTPENYHTQSYIPQNNFQNWDFNLQNQYNPGNTQQIINPNQHMLQMSGTQTNFTPPAQQAQPTITFPNENNQNNPQRSNRQRPQKRRLNS